MKRVVFLFILIVGISNIASSGNSGSIWTTEGDCGDEQQDVNHYGIEEAVYINGATFKPGNYTWEIKGQPGHASCDPNEIVSSGSMTVDMDGGFCFYAYTIRDGDCGEYNVEFNGKKDNYRVDSVQTSVTSTTIPKVSEYSSSLIPLLLLFIAPLLSFAAAKREN